MEAIVKKAKIESVDAHGTGVGVTLWIAALWPFVALVYLLRHRVKKIKVFKKPRRICKKA